MVIKPMLNTTKINCIQIIGRVANHVVMYNFTVPGRTTCSCTAERKFKVDLVHREKNLGVYLIKRKHNDTS